MYYVNVVDTAKVRYSHNDDILLINLGGFDAPVLDDSEMEKYKWKLEDFDTEDDKWSNYPNKYDLEYSINNGKTVFINDLTLYTTKKLSDYIKNGGEVIFGLKSDNGSDWEFNPEISDSLPDDTKVLKADILFKDINTEEDIDEEYTEEFFESVYRESQDPSTKDSEKEADGEIIDQLGNAIDKDFYRVIDEFKKHGEVNKVEVIPLEEFERQDGDIYSITDYFYDGDILKNAKTHFSQWLPDDGKSDYVVKVDVTYAPNMYYSKSSNFSYYLYRSEDVDGSTYRISDIQLYTYDELLKEIIRSPDGEKEFISLANHMIDR